MDSYSVSNLIKGFFPTEVSDVKVDLAPDFNDPDLRQLIYNNRTTSFLFESQRYYCL